MSLIGDIHSPLNNINRYSTSHPEGDNNGKLHKMSYSSGQGIKDQLNATSSNLHDYWSNGLGMFGKIAYALTKLADV